MIFECAYYSYNFCEKGLTRGGRRSVSEIEQIGKKRQVLLAVRVATKQTLILAPR